MTREETTETARAAEKANHASRAADRDRASMREYIESLLVTVILALFGTAFIVQAFKIPSESMEPTLLVGDHLLVNKFIFGGNGSWYDKILPYREVRRGDIVVFKFPYQDHPHYVKRVIGIPGDRVRIVNQQVYVNGQKQVEPYIQHDPGAPYNSFLYNFPPVSPDQLLPTMQPEWADQIFQYVKNGELIVPPGEYFVMGDNRDDSWDSRYWGFVDRHAIMGCPVVIYWSVKSTEAAYAADRSMVDGIEGAFETLIHIPSDTRWNRMFRTLH